jgi:arylsulfatase
MIPAGNSTDYVVTAMDLYPTFAKLSDAPLPGYRIDGDDIWPLMTGQRGAKSSHEAFFYYAGEELQAVRSGRWKLHFPHPYLEVAAEPGRDGKPSNFEIIKPLPPTQSGLEGIASRHAYKVMQLPLSLYDLQNDPGESKNVAAEHADEVKRLQALGERMRDDLGDTLTSQTRRTMP